MGYSTCGIILVLRKFQISEHFWIRDNQPVQCQPKDFNKQVQFVIFQPRV